MDKPIVLMTTSELRKKGVKPLTFEEWENADWKDDPTFERGLLTIYEGSTNEVMKEVIKLLTEKVDAEKEKLTQRFQELTEKLDEEGQKHRPEIRALGANLISNPNPKQRADGLFLLCNEQIGKLFKTIATSGRDIAALREISNEARKVIDEAGMTNVPVGSTMISPASIRANITTTDGAGGYLIEDVFVPLLIDRLFEEFPLFSSFTHRNVFSSAGVVPRMGTGSTAYRRTEGSATTATGITDNQLAYACFPLTAFTVVTKEWFRTAHPALQVQSVVLRELARAESYLLKTEFMTGSNSSTPCGLETENTSGYVNTWTLDGNNRVQSIMEGMKQLGGSKNVPWLDRAVVVANKAAVWSVADEIYNDGRYKLAMETPITGLNIRGLRFNMVETVPNNVYWILVPDEYVEFVVPQLTELTIDGAGYTHVTTNTFTFDLNKHNDMRINANGITTDKDRYAAVRIGPAAA